MDELSDFLIDFIRLLNEWKHLSLVSKNTLLDINGWHFIEAFSIIKFLDKKDDIVDFGAGGGVISIPLIQLGFKISLVERSENKIFFLSKVMKISSVFRSLESFQDKVVIVRGVDAILNLLRILFPCRKLILLKSLNVSDEIKQALKYYFFDFSLHERVGNAKGKILIIENIVLK